jgi:hypothetical protein
MRPVLEIVEVGNEGRVLKVFLDGEIVEIAGGC